ncbi:hypothetical protein ACFV19_13575, partial [Streptomyces griseoluteus]|uniref:hypothetical protein n=1 Tax=Streptomyces griseoluteus TaxID=29306 RepID=UPI0036C7A5C3
MNGPRARPVPRPPGRGESGAVVDHVCESGPAGRRRPVRGEERGGADPGGDTRRGGAGVLAFTAHSVVFTDEDPRWVRGALAAVDCDPLAAPMNPVFLASHMARTGRGAETVDALLVGAPLPGRPALALREIEDAGHPRVRYARGRRDAVRVWTADGGVLVMGRGVGGRLEVSVDVDDGARHRGLGRALVTAARQPAAEPVWAQVSPGSRPPHGRGVAARGAGGGGGGARAP